MNTLIIRLDIRQNSRPDIMPMKIRCICYLDSFLLNVRVVKKYFRCLFSSVGNIISLIMILNSIGWFWYQNFSWILPTVLVPIIFIRPLRIVFQGIKMHCWTKLIKHVIFRLKWTKQKAWRVIQLMDPSVLTTMKAIGKMKRTGFLRMNFTKC